MTQSPAPRYELPVGRMLLGHTKTGAVTPGYLDHHMIETLREGLNAALPELVDGTGRIIPTKDLTTAPQDATISAV